MNIVTTIGIDFAKKHAFTRTFPAICGFPLQPVLLAEGRNFPMGKQPRRVHPHASRARRGCPVTILFLVGKSRCPAARFLWAWGWVWSGCFFSRPGGSAAHRRLAWRATGRWAQAGSARRANRRSRRCVHVPRRFGQSGRGRPFWRPAGSSRPGYSR